MWGLLRRTTRPNRRRADTMAAYTASYDSARCLIMQPSLLILDEPTEGIAPKIVKQIRQEIAEVAGSGISVLLVEQNVRTALRLASRIYLMERGLIVHEATPDALRADPTALHRYLGVSL